MTVEGFVDVFSKMLMSLKYVFSPPEYRSEIAAENFPDIVNITPRYKYSLTISSSIFEIEKITFSRSVSTIKN